MEDYSNYYIDLGKVISDLKEEGLEVWDINFGVGVRDINWNNNTVCNIPDSGYHSLIDYNKYLVKKGE